MGLVSSAISQWAGIFFQTESWNPLLIAILATALLYVLVLIGRYSFFEKVLIVLVTTMSVSFTLTVLLVAPSAEQIITGIIPKSPDEPNASLIISAMVGTTLAPPTFVVRPLFLEAKGWTLTNLADQHKDAAFAGIILFVTNASIMACAAGTLYVSGIPVENVLDMVQTFEPLAGC